MTVPIPLLKKQVEQRPYGKRLATVSGRPGLAGEVKLWDTVSGQEVISLALTGMMLRDVRLAFSPDGTRLAVSVSGTLSGKCGA